MEKLKINTPAGIKAEISKTENGGVEIYKFRLSWTEENAKNNDSITVAWYTPILSDIYRFTPTCAERRFLPADWSGLGQESSMLSHGAPLCSFYDGRGENLTTFALDECKRTVFYRGGVREEDGTLECKFSIGVAQFTNAYSTEFSLRIDNRKIPMGEAVSAVAKWWEGQGITPLTPPESAYEPCYSFWYSYHQNIDHTSVVEECRRAHELGFRACIIDDGWQTDDGNRGYAYCGDWKVAKSKFPDLLRTVKEVQSLGMKFFMWYSVPYMGTLSENFSRFKDMILYYENEVQGVLDPRYKEVRDFLVATYKNALIEYNLDGFKLDFVDLWEPSGNYPPYNEKMDIAELSDAVDTLMTEIISAVRKTKPEAVIEFRQSYIGPLMRKYGYMFRVGDCPYDYLRNHAGICDLRFLLPGSSVHSDMLMWHKDISPTLAAAQIIKVMFGVLQYSARLEYMSPRHKEMSKFWLNFLKEKKELLLFGDFSAYDPQIMYSYAKATKNGECAVGVFLADKCVEPDAENTVYIANGTNCDRVLLDLRGSYTVRIYDCFGKITDSFEKDFDSVTQLPVTTGGLAVLTKK